MILARPVPKLKVQQLFLMWIILGVVGFGALLATGILTVPKHKYCMVLDEDWSNGINPDVWQHEIQVGGFGNGEFQWTTDSSNNSYVKDGKLYITPTLTVSNAHNSMSQAHVYTGRFHWL